MSTRYFDKAYPFRPPLLCLEHSCRVALKNPIAFDAEGAIYMFECFNRVKPPVWDLALPVLGGKK